MHNKMWIFRNSLAVQWLGLHALTAEGPGSVPGGGPKIPQAEWHRQKIIIKIKSGIFKKYESVKESRWSQFYLRAPQDAVVKELIRT